MTEIFLFLSVFLFGMLVGVLIVQETTKKIAKRIIDQECDRRGIL
jgi:hypothetical protein